MPNKRKNHLLSKDKAARDARHLIRYLMSKSGLAVEEIARKEKVSLRSVQDSIRRCEAYETQNSDGELQLAVRNFAISMIPEAKESLSGLLKATTVVDWKDSKTGLVKSVEVEDKTTRLEAVKAVTGLVASLQPKGPGVSVSVSQTNQTAVLSSHETNEERLKRLRARAQEHNLLPPEVAAVPEYIDQGDDDSGDDDDEDDEE